MKSVSSTLQDNLQRIDKLRKTQSHKDYRRRARQEFEQMEQRQALADCQLPRLIKHVIECEWRETDTYLSLRRAAALLLQTNRHFLIAWGPRGAGKTIGLAMVAAEVVAASDNPLTAVRFLSAKEYGDCENFKFAAGMEQIARAAGILILDDVGQETRFPERIVTTLTVRHNEAAMTFISCNCSPEHLRYDLRITDRLVERGVAEHCVVVERPGQKVTP